MAEIIINEISQNYSYVVNDTSFATVALPITSSWGPGYFDPSKCGSDDATMKDETVWTRFPATQEGIESFVSTYRGPIANYRLAQDFSYHAALSLLSSGYAVLTCRLSQGDFAHQAKDIDNTGEFIDPVDSNNPNLSIKAKYVGEFGNHIKCKLKHTANDTKYTIIVYTVDSTGAEYAVENLSFVADAQDATDSCLYYKEITSNFIELQSVDFSAVKSITIDAGKHKEDTDSDLFKLENGTDVEAYTDKEKCYQDTCTLAEGRFTSANITNSEYVTRIRNLKSTEGISLDIASLTAIHNREWVFAKAGIVYELLNDKLAYNPNRIITPCWDDQDTSIWDTTSLSTYDISPLTQAVMTCAAASRCAIGYVDVPRTMKRSSVMEYANRVSEFTDAEYSIDGLFATHSAMFGPWGTFVYTGTSKYNFASPSFIALLVQKSMIENQTLQYEWIQPSTRTNFAKIGSLAYTLPKSSLDEWQPEPDTEGGVGVNALTTIPGLGLTIWGDATLFKNEPATYQALRNMSTRLLVNAIKDAAYKAGISITFNYNNQTAYSKFYVSVTPLLETMQNAGAIEDFRVEMSHDLDAIGQVKANSCVGKIYIVPVGTIQRIDIDLIALPPGTSLS